MVDTKLLRLYAKGGPSVVGLGRDRMTPDEEQELRQLLRAAAAEIDAGRVERLVQYRCAALNAHLASGTGTERPGVQERARSAAACAEVAAHAMLTAERAPKSEV